jgi:transposase
MKKLTNAERAHAVRDYGRGESIRAVAQKYGCSYGTIHKLLVEVGASMRPRGGNHR